MTQVQTSNSAPALLLQTSSVHACWLLPAMFQAMAEGLACAAATDVQLTPPALPPQVPQGVHAYLLQPQLGLPDVREHDRPAVAAAELLQPAFTGAGDRSLLPSLPLYPGAHCRLWQWLHVSLCGDAVSHAALQAVRAPLRLATPHPETCALHACRSLHGRRAGYGGQGRRGQR